MEMRLRLLDSGIDELDGKRFIVDNWDNGAFTLEILDQDRNPIDGRRIPVQ